MLRVLNIAQFIPIKGLDNDNDISLKIYLDLERYYGMKSQFVKPVGNIPKWLKIFKKSLRQRSDIYSNDYFFDSKHHIRINFYKDRLPLINRVPFNTDFLIPLEYKIYSSSLKEFANNFLPDFIHAHSIFPDGYYALRLSRKLNIPFILTLRGTYSKQYTTGIGWATLQEASAITTPSYSLWSDLKNNFSVHLLPHGTDDFWFDAPLRKYVPGRIRLVTVCRLLEMKNIQVVLKTVQMLLNDGYQVEYNIVGDGNYSDNLKQITNELGLEDCVRFHGYQTAEYIKQIYAHSDIFVMLSYPETFGLSYFEAAAQGLYIIGVRNTGAFGHFSEQEATFIKIDSNELCRALKSLDIEEYESKTNLLRNKMDNYRKNKIIDRYFKLLSGLTTKKEVSV